MTRITAGRVSPSAKVSSPLRKSRLGAGWAFLGATVVGMHEMRRLLSVFVLLVAVVLGVGILAPTSLVDAAAAQIEPLDEPVAEDPPGLGSIIGSPEAGPKPEDAGDRGGWAQLFLAVVLFVGVGFILTRIFKAATANQTAT